MSASAVRQLGIGPNGAIRVFDPSTTKRDHAKIEALIEYATKVNDWPLLEEAIDAKITQQREFVRWWTETVSVRESPGRDGIKSNAERSSISRERAEQLSGISQQQVSRWRKRLADPAFYRELQLVAAYRKANLAPAENHRARGTGIIEWFTPPQYLDAARKVLGEIDLDPASHPIAQGAVQAKNFFVRADDSLSRSWPGRVWLNPPYARTEIGRFIDKLIAEVSLGNTTAAVLLTHSYTDTGWFHQAASTAKAICFTLGRIRFTDAAGNPCAPTQGQTFFYYGIQTDLFRSVFTEFGLTVRIDS